MCVYCIGKMSELENNSSSLSDLEKEMQYEADDVFEGMGVKVSVSEFPPNHDQSLVFDILSSNQNPPPYVKATVIEIEKKHTSKYTKCVRCQELKKVYHRPVMIVFSDHKMERDMDELCDGCFKFVKSRIEDGTFVHDGT